jgi:hypothetical protein
MNLNRSHINEDRFWAKVDRRKDSECWIWTGAMTSSSRNYGTFWVRTSRKDGKLHRASKISLFLRTGEQPKDKQMVLHSCDNPPCVNPLHLRYGTHQDNCDDAVNRKRYRPTCQQENKSAKLTADKANEIRTAWRLGIGCRKLAKLFGVESRSLRKIIHGKSWVSKC